MKTVGEILHSERLKKDLSLERLSSLTKIDIKYLDALEKNNYDLLPSETFIKGFIRNISLRLDKDPNELIAIFRRGYNQNEKKSPTKNPSPKRQKIFFEPSRFLPAIIGVIVFLGYLGFQFRAVLALPKIELQKPIQDSVVVSPVEIEGDTSVDSLITIGDDVKLRPDETGHFSAKISLPIGETTLQLKATNRFGRSSTKKIPFTIISK